MNSFMKFSADTPGQLHIQPWCCFISQKTGEGKKLNFKKIVSGN